MPCADCYRGNDHPGPVVGNEIKLHGYDVYITQPQSKTRSPNALIVVLSDAFGWNTNNLRRLADSYAERTSCTVYVPDFMHGTAAPSSTKALVNRILSERGLLAWLVKPWLFLRASLILVPFFFRNNVEKRYPGIRNFMDDLRCGEAADSKVGVVGFCWGGYGATQLAHGGLARNGKTLIDAAYTAHPSELKVPGDIERVKLPYSVVVGDVDFAMPLKEVQRSVEILEAKENVHSEVVIIPNAKHGFAVRGNPDDKLEKDMADQAEDQMVRWFARYLV
ncbi:related to dienelactone hydrolase family protein [Cephalotrichum gorgonifer]|uniref:Related to dienelactone hydrolase family protein n=1 Tax=Cephalotrichum gorgonifer TaxID=2041049 RepID=A0AAE8SQS7_9PEZI|nr:related to dienelactone hydrolase family protein [Cephalotrichum gorgonifer]